MEYQRLPGLTPDGVVYWNEARGMAESVLPPGPYATAHAPALLEMDNGDLLCAWFAGSFEGSADISVVCARLPKGAGKWEEPVRVSRDPERSEQNPSLFLGPDGAVWVIYTAQMDRMPGKTNMQFTSIIRCQKSTDGGMSWSAPEVLFPREGSFCRQPIQVLESGRWLFTNWFCKDDNSNNASDYTVIQVSDDKGKNWRGVEMPGSAGRVHANIIELGGGRLVAFMRSRAADFIYRSESKDGGDSWSPAVPTTLPNNNSSISAAKLDSGRIAIAYNPTCTRNPVANASAWPGLRCPVAVALSEDEGLTWPMIRHMELGEGFVGNENRTNNKQYEYPFLMQGTDGDLHLAYAYANRVSVKYMRFSEADIMGAKRETEGVYNPTAAQK